MHPPKDVLVLLIISNERLIPEAIRLVIEQLDEGDDETPGVRSGNDDTLEQDSADTLGDSVGDLGAGRGTEEEEDEGGEEERVSGGVSKLVGDDREHVVLA